MQIMDDFTSRNDLDRVVIGATLGNVLLGRPGGVVGGFLGLMIKQTPAPTEPVT